MKNFKLTLTTGLFRWSLILVLTFMQTQIAYGQTAVRSPDLSRARFRAALALRPDLRPLSAGTSSMDTDLAIAKAKLNKTLEAAQVAFLDGSLSEAKRLFSELADMSTDADWPLIQRRAIHYAILRAAQLSEDPTEQTSLLKRAIALDPVLNPDTTLFPPPLLHSLSSVSRELAAQAIEIRVRDRFGDFEILKINGRTYHVAETPVLRVYPGMHRLRLQSDAFAPVTQTLSATQLMIYVPPKATIATGTCEHPAVESSSLPLQDVTVIFSETCVQARRGGVWTRTDDTIPNSASGADAERAALVPSLPEPLGARARLATSPGIPAGLELQEPAPAPPFYKKGWFWMGVTGVAVASALLIAREQRRTRDDTSPISPSQTHGF